jgi:cytochrome d ubiquinol oxidase subunit I
MYLLIYAVLMTAFITTLFYMARKAGLNKSEPLAPASGQAIVEALK